jgi:hypothetical protein
LRLLKGLLGVLKRLLMLLHRLLGLHLLEHGLLLCLHLLQHGLLGCQRRLLDMCALPLAPPNESIGDDEHTE